MAAAAADLLAHPAVAHSWDEPSALAGYAVSGLAGHLASQINVVAKVLDAPAPDTEPISALDHLVLEAPGSDHRPSSAPTSRASAAEASISTLRIDTLSIRKPKGVPSLRQKAVRSRAVAMQCS